MRRALFAVVLSSCGGGSQVYLDSTDEPLPEPGTRIEPYEGQPARPSKRRAGPSMYTIHLETSCDAPARLFVGRRRDDENGEELTLSAGQSTSRSGFLPVSVFLLDSAGATVVEVEATAGSQTIRIAASCAALERVD